MYDKIAVAIVGRLLRRRWPVLLVLGVLGALLGLACSSFLSPGFVSTSKVLLQGSRDAKELSGEADVATSLIVLDKTAAVLGRGTGTDLRSKVTAALDGNVITISGSGATPEEARRLTAEATTQYLAFSTQIVSDAAAASSAASQQRRDAIQQRIDDANEQITQLESAPALTAAGPDGVQTRAALDQAQTVASGAAKELQQLDAVTQSTVLDASMAVSSAHLIQLATLPATPAAPTVVQLVVCGAAAAVVLGVFAHLVMLRRDRRLRDPRQISEALGARLLGVVAVAVPTPAKSLLARISNDDRRWAQAEVAVVEDDRSRAAREARILRRARAAAGRAPAPDAKSVSLLVLFPDGDPAAVGATAELVCAAAADEPVTVVAEGVVAEQIRATAQRRGIAAHISITDASAPRPGPIAVEVMAIRLSGLILPDPAPGVVVNVVLVVAAGTPTEWDLTGVSGACLDAGQHLAGVVVATSAGRVPRRADGPPAVASDDGQAPAGMTKVGAS